jgi:hypothetical protein
MQYFSRVVLCLTSCQSIMLKIDIRQFRAYHNLKILIIGLLVSQKNAISACEKDAGSKKALAC